MEKKRNIYIVNEEGIIEKIFEKVKAQEAAEMVVNYLEGK